MLSTPLLCTLPLLSTLLPTLPLLSVTWLRSPPTPTTMVLPTTTPRLPSASPRATMAQVLLRAPTLSTFLTDVSRPSLTTPTILMDTLLRSPTPVRLPTLWLPLLPTLSTLPPSLPTLSTLPLFLPTLSTLPLLLPTPLPTLWLWPTLPLWLWDKLLWILFMKVIYFMKNIAQSEQKK